MKMKALLTSASVVIFLLLTHTPSLVHLELLADPVITHSVSTHAENEWKQGLGLVSPGEIIAQLPKITQTSSYYTPSRAPPVKMTFNQVEQNRTRHYALGMDGGATSSAPAKNPLSFSRTPIKPLLHRPPSPQNSSSGKDDHFLAPHVLPKLRQNPSIPPNYSLPHVSPPFPRRLFKREREHADGMSKKSQNCSIKVKRINSGKNPLSAANGSVSADFDSFVPSPSWDERSNGEGRITTVPSIVAETGLLGGSVPGGITISPHQQSDGKNNNNHGDGLSGRTTTRAKSTAPPDSCTHCDNYYQGNPGPRHPNFMNSNSPFPLFQDHPTPGPAHNANSRPSSSSSTLSPSLQTKAHKDRYHSANGHQIMAPEEVNQTKGNGNNQLTIPFRMTNPGLRMDPLQNKSDKVRIHCMCDTAECTSKEQLTCTTVGSCYTQILAEPDGSSSITRGCISSPTPLLCENRRPKIVTRWPRVNCCSTNMCNMGNLTRLNYPRAPARNLKTPDPNSRANTIIGQSLSPANATLLPTIILVRRNKDKIQDSNRSIPTKLLPLQRQSNSTGVFPSTLPFPPESVRYTTTPSLADQRNNLIRLKIQNATFYQTFSTEKKSVAPGTNPTVPAHSFPKVSPLAAVFLIGGAILIIIISGVSYFILKKEESLTRASLSSKEDVEELEDKEESSRLCRLDEVLHNPRDMPSSSSATLHANLLFYHTSQREPFPESLYSTETFVIHDEDSNP